MITMKISENEGGQRLDRFLRKYLKTAPLSMIYRMIRKDIKLNGRRVSKDTQIQSGDELTLYIDEEKLAELIESPQRKTAKREFGLVYEDDYILIVDKPAGLLTHGDSNEKKNTLVNQVVGYLYEQGQYNPSEEKTFTPASANRLDRNTSGLVAFGKTYEGIKELNRFLRGRDMLNKYYLTIVNGKFRNKMILKDKMIKDEEKNRVRVLNEDSKVGSLMEMVVKPVSGSEKYTLIEIELITGRTHQIRAQLAKAGYPVIGDKKYGNARNNVIMDNRYGLRSQFLHAYKLKFGDNNGKLAYLNGRIFEVPLPAKLKTIGEDLNVI